jgi:hypothetical protein
MTQADQTDEQYLVVKPVESLAASGTGRSSARSCDIKIIILAHSPTSSMTMSVSCTFFDADCRETTFALPATSCLTRYQDITMVDLVEP